MSNSKDDGQLSIFSNGMSSPDAVRKMVLESPREYLRRGERLITLAKEHLQATVHKKMPDLEAAIYGISLDVAKPSAKECMIKLRNLVGGYLRAIMEEGDEPCKALCSMTGGRVSIKIRKDLSNLKQILKGAPDDVIIEVNIKKGDNEPHKFFCLKNKSVGFTKKSHVRMYNQTFMTEDVRSILGYIILYNEIEKALQDDTLSEILFTEVREKYLDRELVFRSISGMFCDSVCRVFINAFRRGNLGDEILPSVINREIQRYLESGHILKVAVPEKVILSDRLIKNLEQYGISICVWPEDGKALTEKAALLLKKEFGDRISDLGKEVQEILGQMVVPMPDHLNAAYFGSIFWADNVLAGELLGFYDAFFMKSRFSGRGAIIREHFGDSCGNPGCWYWDRWLFKLFYVVYTHQHEVLVQWREYKESAAEYAKSYMNKAGLPQKTLQAMQTSLLNDFFGFVEYDEDVDLKKAGEVEKMFLAVKETYLKRFDASRNAIRFRKLGNHNAAGLYYPGVKCLCIDYRHPYCFIHEFGHLIDYECGNLSLERGFYRVKCLYQAWVSKYEDTFNKKSKYNYQYYLKPTEIFARSFEVYCRKVLEIENDLLPDKFEEAVYPNDTQYIKEVTAYFNSLLGRKAA